MATVWKLAVQRRSSLNAGYLILDCRNSTRSGQWRRPKADGQRLYSDL